MSRPQKARASTQALLAAAAGLAAAAICHAADDPITVHLPDAPEAGVQDLYFETVWEQPAESEDFLLSGIIDAAFDHDGNICIVDFRQKNLKIFAPGGRWLRTLGREGEGPGEFRDARRLFLAGDGRYGLLQLLPGTIVWLHTDGTPAGKVRIEGPESEEEGLLLASWATQWRAEMYVWLRRTHLTEGIMNDEEWATRIDEDGSLGPVLYQAPEDEYSANPEDGLDEGKVYDIWQDCWAPDGRGGIWVAPERDRYNLQNWNADGELVRKVFREYEPVVRTEKVRENIVRAQRRRGWSDDQVRPGRTAPVVFSLRLGDDGNLWVRLYLGGNEPNEDTWALYDVIDPDGRWLKQLRLRADRETTGSRLLDDRTLLALFVDDDTGEATLALLRAVSE